jgi:hypothetical protein
MMILSNLPCSIQSINKRTNTRSQIQFALQNYKNENKILIFCDRKITCDTFNEIYNDVSKYYSDIVNKDETLKRWTSELMLTIEALEIKMNVDSILWVYHWDLSTKMIEFDQEMKREDRKGEVIYSMILFSKSMFRQ